MDDGGHSGSRAELERGALLAVRELVDRMRTLYRDLEQSTGAPIVAHRALACVGDEPGIPASKLAAELGMQRPATSHVLKSLESRTWIERRRSPADQRSVRIHLTPEGRKLLNATRGRAVGTLQRAVGNLADAELRAVARAVRSILSTLPVRVAATGRGTARRPAKTQPARRRTTRRRR
jgi:DNA-binding MarR family transcriptional regulator